MSEDPQLQVIEATRPLVGPYDRGEPPTMEHPFEEGTLAGVGPRRVDPPPPVGRSPWRWLVIPGSALAVVWLSGMSPESPHSEPTPVLPTGVAALRRALADRPEGPSDLQIRSLYAARLVDAQQYPDAFEEYLTIVRRSPESASGHDALAGAVEVSGKLAHVELNPGLWTDRWVAAVDRYARYWPGDPITDVLVEDTVASLSALGRIEHAEFLISEHIQP